VEAHLHTGNAEEELSMRLQILISIAALVAGCVPQIRSFSYSDISAYRPKPTIAVSGFAANDQVVMAYVRHSQGNVLLHLVPNNMGYELSKHDIEMDVQLDSSQPIVFNSGSYENFDRSLDVYHDGRIILVPLPESNGRNIGAFVNLLSGERYFFAPTVTSDASMAIVKQLARRWDVTVIVPEDRRAHERLGIFPEFQQ
jgi:hypothetical protein